MRGKKTLKDMFESGAISQEFYNLQVRVNKNIRRICKADCRANLLEDAAAEKKVE